MPLSARKSCVSKFTAFVYEFECGDCWHCMRCRCLQNEALSHQLLSSTFEAVLQGEALCGAHQGTKQCREVGSRV